MNKIKILITGANGFIGGHLMTSLAALSHYQLVAGVSSRAIKYYPAAVVIDEAFTPKQWQDCLQGFDVIIHCAARAHKTKENQHQQRERYQTTNVDMPVNMAQAAVQVGVKQFVFMSSVGVNGAVSAKPFTEADDPCPHNVYTNSKYAAETALLDIANASDLNLCVLRLPLVYGPGVGANFLSLISVVNKGIPLPLGAIKNKRSFLGVENLCDLIVCVLNNQKVRNQVFLLADVELTVPKLIADIACGLHKKNRLINFPLPMLQFLLRILGKGALVNQLCEPLLIDATKSKNMFGWQPRVSYEKGLENTLKHFVAEANDE